MVLLLEPVCVHGDEIAGGKHVPGGKMTAGGAEEILLFEVAKNYEQRMRSRSKLLAPL
jgi:hypothetical protein